jgi:elongator complex protein 3
LTIETRPDYATLKHANIMLEQGCTRVELGVQTTDNKALSIIKRGHSIEETKKAFKTLKDLGFKINAHIMLGLPEDKNNLLSLFTDSDLRPDMLKIYPCIVMPGTELESMYKQGKYKPLSTEETIKILADFKTKVPEYVRIMRIQRDIPTKHSIAGANKTNLRQLLQNFMQAKKLHCNCIRCNEIKSKIINPKINTLEYEASNGKEFFISIKQNNEIIGFCRLRFPSQTLRKEITKNTAIIRELHVYGTAAGIDEIGNVQHKGFGKILLKKAEEICKLNSKNKLLVISGIGAREYYKKLGYKQNGIYVSKKIYLLKT